MATSEKPWKTPDYPRELRRDHTRMASMEFMRAGQRRVVLKSG